MALDPTNKPRSLRVDSTGRLLTSPSGGGGGSSDLTYTGTWAGKPASPTTGDKIRATDVHPLVPVDFYWNGTAWVTFGQPPPTRDLYVQPSDGSTWALRPVAASISVPVWATRLSVFLGAGGMGGGSGRRGAAGSARSGGQGGGGGSVAAFSIPLRNVAGTLVAATGSLTCGAGTLGGAAVTVNDTSGNPGAGNSQQTTFDLNSVVYRAPGGGGPAAGGAAIALGDNNPSLSTTFPAASAWGRTSVTTAISTLFPTTLTCGGGGGGGIDTANALVATGAIQHVGRGEGSITAAGANGSYELFGNVYISRAPTGGAASNVAAAQAGGIGLAGCGGGGGGASLNGFNSGAGGKGGDGWAVLMWE